MWSAENRANVDSEIVMRQMLERTLLELANRIKQVPQHFVKHVLQEVLRKFWATSSIVCQYKTKRWR